MTFSFGALAFWLCGGLFRFDRLYRYADERGSCFKCDRYPVQLPHCSSSPSVCLSLYLLLPSFLFLSSIAMSSDERPSSAGMSAEESVHASTGPLPKATNPSLSDEVLMSASQNIARSLVEVIMASNDQLRSKYHVVSAWFIILISLSFLLFFPLYRVLTLSFSLQFTHSM